MALAATIEGPVTAQERKPVDITPETTAKQLAEAVEERGEDVGSLAQNAAWLKAGPFSGQIIQALFCLPFKAEEVSENPVETLAAIYLKVRRHWPVYTKGCATWLLGVMRDWWGGLPVDVAPHATPRQQLHPDAQTDEDGERDWPEEVDVSFSTTGAVGRVPVTVDYSATIVFTDEDKDALLDILCLYRDGALTKSAAIDRVASLIDERTRDCYYDGNADEVDDHWDNDYADLDRDDESIDDIESRGVAVGIVNAWG